MPRAWQTIKSIPTIDPVSAVTPTVEVNGFQQAEKFSGAKPGMVFKMGGAGLGYYVDAKR